MKEINHLELWINTKYFLDATRCVNSLKYLEKHFNVLEFIDGQDFVDAKLHRFYINLCDLVDKHCEITKSKKKINQYKKMLRTMCPSFNWIYYERDKNAAHKDKDYNLNINISLKQTICEMEKTLYITKLICSNIISDKVSLYFYEYDPLLFRYVHGITPDIEQKFNSKIYLNKNREITEGRIFYNIVDARQVRSLDSNKNYCITVRNGLMGQPYDMLQKREDMCIKMNCLYGWDTWIKFHEDMAPEMLNYFFKLIKMVSKEG